MIKPSTVMNIETPKSEHTIRIHGGRPLRGTVRVGGAKNSVPKNLVAALLTEEPCTLRNVSAIQDVDIVTDMLKDLGCEVMQREPSSLDIRAASIGQLPPDTLRRYAGKSRIPVLLCGPLLARTGEALIPTLGGCQIGSRPIDFHLAALKQLGAVVSETDDSIRLVADKLRGARIVLDYPSVGATEQVLLASVLADGVTALSNAAIEPEIIDLIALLQRMGAIISVAPDREITIVGVPRLRGFDYVAMPDRLEAASWACAAAATNGQIRVEGAKQLDMMAFLNKFREIGGEFDIDTSSITFRRGSDKLSAVTLETDVHPGFMTDWQQPFAVTTTQAHGVSVIHETVYENRFGYVDALNDMGAHVELHKACLGGLACRFGRKNFLHSAVIVGPTRLRPAEIVIPDLRGGFSYIIAALVADGWSTLHNYPLIRRGYERFSEKLKELGVEFEVTS